MMRLEASARRSTDPARRASSEDPEADVAGFFGVELHAGDAPALDRRRKRHAVGRRSPPHSATTGATYECVKYTCASVRRRRAMQTALARGKLQAVPADVRAPSNRGAWSSGALRTQLPRVRWTHEPRNRRQDPARPAPRRCLRTTTACRGRSRRGPPRDRRPRGSRCASASSIARVASKWPTPGHDDAARRRRAPPAARGVATVSAERRQRLAHRRQVAGAVIDQRDHSRPFVLGSIFAMPLVLRARHAQRARERLEARLDLVMIRAAVQHLEVHVGARAAGEALEEVVHELGSADRRPGGPSPWCRRRYAARPPRSTAATASVSSIGMTK